VIAVDTNVLVHAHRAHMPEHAIALAALRHLAEHTAPWAVPVFCLGEFVRVVTHPRVFDPPTTAQQALEAVEELMRSPGVRVLSPGQRYPELFCAAVRAANARGNLVFDAQIAAVCREHGVTRLLTLDRDFTRFPEIEIVTFADVLRRQ
jgi:uncharacterized protein